MTSNFDVKLVIIFLLVIILFVLVGLTISVLKDHKSSFKFYKSILNDKNKNNNNKKSNLEK